MEVGSSAGEEMPENIQGQTIMDVVSFWPHRLIFYGKGVAKMAPEVLLCLLVQKRLPFLMVPIVNVKIHAW